MSDSAGTGAASIFICRHWRWSIFICRLWRPASSSAGSGAGASTNSPFAFIPGLALPPGQVLPPSQALPPGQTPGTVPEDQSCADGSEPVGGQCTVPIGEGETTCPDAARHRTVNVPFRRQLPVQFLEIRLYHSRMGNALMVHLKMLMVYVLQTEMKVHVLPVLLILKECV